MVLDRVIAKFSLSAEEIIDHLYTSPVFDPDRRSLVTRGIYAWLQKDHFVAAYVLTPEIEAVLRRLLVSVGGSIYKPSRTGGLLLRNLEEILRDDAIKQVLQDRIIIYFRILLTEQRGLNLRNSICHGLVPASILNRPVTDRLLHVLLVLALFRLKDREDESEKLPEQDNSSPGTVTG